MANENRGKDFDWLVTIIALLGSIVVVLSFWQVHEGPDKFRALMIGALPSALVVLVSVPLVYVILGRRGLSRSQLQDQWVEERFTQLDDAVADLGTRLDGFSAVLPGQQEAVPLAAAPPEELVEPGAADLDASLEVLLVMLYDVTADDNVTPLLSTPATRLGIHVGKLSTRPDGELIMDHVRAWRMRDDIDISDIPWTKGKGVIGRAWQLREAVYYDFSWRQDATREDWDALPDEDRIGLTFDEYTVMRRKYGSVLAVPVCLPEANEEMIGCIVIDTPAGFDDPLNNSDVVAAVTLVSRKWIGELLSKL